MKLKKISCATISFMLLSAPGILVAQTDSAKKISVSGYISNMQSATFEHFDEEWINDNLFHNRLNIFYYPFKNLTSTIQFRNRFMYGETVEDYPGYADAVDEDIGFMDLSMNIFSENSFFLNVSIDRIYIQLTRNRFVSTLGRQRINWGINTVWNPNDIFNVQNYFDFDYIEKPGSDALRLQYYTGPASAVEVAGKLDQEKRLTTAVYYKFSKWGYDFQFLGGIFEANDLMAGTGWAGDIRNVSFKGEFSYFHPAIDSIKNSDTWLISLGGDYMFSNSIFIQAEALYCKFPAGMESSSFISWYLGTLNVKKLSFTEVNLFASISYPFTPLLNGGLAGMYFPEIRGYYAGPSVDYSVTDNVQISLITQLFSGEYSDPLTGAITRNELFLGFLRFKFNF